MPATRAWLAAALLGCAAAQPVPTVGLLPMPGKPFVTTLAGDGGPNGGATYINTPGTSTMYSVSLADVDPLARLPRDCGACRWLTRRLLSSLQAVCNGASSQASR